jgi:hypothetical protein
MFKIQDHFRVNRFLTGKQVFYHRMDDKAWSLNEFQENGRMTANTKHLDKEDKVVFYLCGDDEGHCLLGDAVLDSKFGVSLKSVFHEEYMDLLKGVKLKKVNPWKKEMPIEKLRGKVRFVPVGKNYGSYIQGSITSISKDDYQTIMRMHE